MDIVQLGQEEARSLTERIRSGLESVRSDLHAMYVGQGYLALGYGSFNNWLEEEFDIHYSYLYRQTHAALLETKLDLPIGTHKESHLRPLIEILGPDEQVEAYGRVHNGRTAADYKVAAMETYLAHHGPDILRLRCEGGLVAVQSAYEIAKLINEDGSLLQPIRTLLSLTSDSQLAKALIEMSKRGGETWLEIFHSRTIPAFPEPIPIDKATIHNLKAWLDVASAEHRAQAVESNKDKYDTINALTVSLIETTKEVVTLGLAGREIRQDYWQLLSDLLGELDRVRRVT